MMLEYERLMEGNVSLYLRMLIVFKWHYGRQLLEQLSKIQIK